MPGATWWVEGPRGVASRGAVGHATVEPTPSPALEETPYDLASLTKPLATAPLLLMAAERGELDLDDPASRWLPELAGSPHEECTLHELATHTSGLPAWLPLYVSGGGIDGYLGTIARTPRAVERGVTVYSDLGYVLLGAILERVTGRSLDALFEERMAAPSGVRRLAFATQRARFDDAAATERGNCYERALAGRAGDGYAWRTEIPAGQVHDGNCHGLGGVAGHAGLFGAAESVARLALDLGPRGRVGLGERACGRLLEPVPETEGRTVGMVVAAQARAGRGILPAAAPGHTGFTGTSLWFLPGGEAVMVLLTNRVHPEVTRRDFALVRRGFHRLALRALEASAGS
jgi:CubicO group peptidase (beta-lactamase class C family)